ncbi:Heterodisulfide reductase subunit A [Thermoplasmatales archaeon SCGC AB-539-N05]|nr:Heterodisulfide reductase subunit A [Thermoplasmatales archaeon SCGC AB-539-N05]ENO12451.1 FAD binding protein [Thermoplasmatales archaeon SCGC AB-539-C06]
MKEKNQNTDVLVIGAGIAGIEASLMLSKADRKVHLVEKTSYTGGAVIKYEEVFSNMECSTCMVAPRQQDLLQDKNINLLTLTDVEEIKGSPGDFTVKINKKARYVDMDNCIGCDACFEPCPVSLKNEFEEGLSERKAIYVPCAGALPNVPMIDTEHCLHFKGKDCKACQEACMFEAIDFKQKDEQLELKVGGIIAATGFKIFDPEQVPQYGYGKFDDIYTAVEFERLYASNGPTEGNIVLKNGKAPKSAAIVHCVGRDKKGYCSSVCCMYSLKFNHYLKSKIPEIKISEFYTDLCIPGKSHQKFYEKMKETGTDLIRVQEVKIDKQGKEKTISYNNGNKKDSFQADMIILASAIEPRDDVSKLAKILGISLDEYGFFKEENPDVSSVITSKPGVFIAGCVQGPKNIQDSVSQASAAVGKVLSLSS